MSSHPLIDLATDKRVKQAKGFRAVAAEHTGETLEPLYQAEIQSAPRRQEAGKKFLGVKSGRTPNRRQAGKDDRHLAMAIGAWAAGGDGALEMPGGDILTIVDALVPLRTAAPDRSKGDADPNKGVEDLHLLGLLPDERMAAVCLKYLPADATRGGAGDTPLRALLEGLAQVAVIDANRAAIGEEIAEATGRSISEEAPVLILAASPRYWEICRKREAQKGAAWIRELERLARECATSIGVEVFFFALEIEGEDPVWTYGDDGPILRKHPELEPAWELGAGKLKPKPKRSKSRTESSTAVVEADLSREPRPYSVTASYDAGDRIDHPKLGSGVVQASVGRGKITVLFGDETKILVHERPPR